MDQSGVPFKILVAALLGKHILIIRMIFAVDFWLMMTLSGQIIVYVITIMGSVLVSTPIFSIEMPKVVGFIPALILRCIGKNNLMCLPLYDNWFFLVKRKL